MSGAGILCLPQEFYQKLTNSCPLQELTKNLLFQGFYVILRLRLDFSPRQGPTLFCRSGS